MPSRSAHDTYPLLTNALMAAVAVVGCAMLVISPLLIELAQAFDVSLSRAGLIPAWYGASLAITAPLIGLVAQQLPRAVLICAGLGLYGVAWLVAAQAGSFSTVLGAFACAGAATGIVQPACYATAGDLAAAGAGARATGRIVGGWSIAFLSVLPFNALAQWIGWRQAFAGLGLLALTIAGIIALAPHPGLRVAAAAGFADRVATAVRTVTADANTRRLLLANALDMGGFFAIYTFLGVSLRGSNDWGASLAGLVMSAYGLGLSIVTLGAVHVERAGPRRAGRTALFCLVPLLVLLPWATSAPWVAGAMIMTWGCLQGTVFAALTTLANESLPVHRGVVAAAMSGATYVGVSSFTAMAAAIHAELGYGPVGVLSGAACVAAAVLMRAPAVGRTVRA